MASGITSPVGTAAATPPTSNAATISRAAGGAMGKDQFLQLLVAQMKNQDPMNPQDGSQMAAQLAQFSSVEQLTQINETLTSQGSGQSSLAQLMAENGALSTVGKHVMVSAGAVDTTSGAPGAISADLPAGAASAKLRVFDANGKEVAAQDLGAVSGGRRAFDVSSRVKGLPGGVYKYVVEATGTSGEVVNAPTYVSGTVTGVRYTTQGPVLTVGGAALPYMSVTEVTG